MAINTGLSLLAVQCGQQGAEWSGLHNAHQNMTPEATRWREEKHDAQTEQTCSAT